MIKLNEKNNSEIIVNNIINKIISLTISKSLNIKVEKKIPEKCNDYVIDSINNLISTFYIFYDKDEERNKKEKSMFKCDFEEIKENEVNDINRLEFSLNENNSFSDNYFFNNFYSGQNDWDLMDEPISSNIDRYSSTLIKLEEKKLGIEGKYEINQEKIIEEEENILENNKIRKENKKLSSKIKAHLNNLYKYSINTFLNKEENNKKIIKSEISNQLKTIDLEPEKNYENKQIIKLRAILEKQQKEKEKEKQIDKEKREKIIIKQKVAEEKMRQYIGKKINKDHNGEIIFIKSLKPNMLKKEFILSNSKCKIIKIKHDNNSKPKTKEKEKEINIEKNIESEKKEKPKQKKIGKPFNTRLKLLHKIETNTDKKVETHSIPLKKRIPIITSGSNFFLMNMEVGVSLKEDEKFKTGGLDFFNRYKKYSLEVYNKKLKDSGNLNNLVKNKELLTEPKTSTIEEMHNLYKTNYTLGTSTFDENNSSLLNTETNLFNKKINNNMVFLNNTNNSSLFKNYLQQANMSTYKIKNNLNLTPVINTKLKGSSLLNSFDKLNLALKEEKHSIKKTKNLFRVKMAKKAKKHMLEDMNTFTKNLLLNKKDNNFNEKFIMNTTGGIRGISNPGKPNIREIIQEIGVKGKLLRERKKFLPSIKSNILENENFFKQ